MAQRIENSVLNNLDVDTYHDKAFKEKLYVPATQAADEIYTRVEAFITQ